MQRMTMRQYRNSLAAIDDDAEVVIRSETEREMPWWERAWRHWLVKPIIQGFIEAATAICVVTASLWLLLQFAA